MSSASKVGELFRAAGQVFCQLGDLTAQLQSFSDKTSPSTGYKSKKRSLEPSPNTEAAGIKKLITEQNVSSANKVILKRQMSTTSDVTLSALNSPDPADLDVDIEGLVEHQQSGIKMKLEYE